jgi:hypothetical protein
MNLASDAKVDSFAVDCSFGAADWSLGAGAVGVCDWAIAPEIITPLTAVVITSVLSIVDLLHDGNVQLGAASVDDVTNEIADGMRLNHEPE